MNVACMHGAGSRGVIWCMPCKLLDACNVNAHKSYLLASVAQVKGHACNVCLMAFYLPGDNKSGVLCAFWLHLHPAIQIHIRGKNLLTVVLRSCCLVSSPCAHKNWKSRPPKRCRL